MSAEYKKIKVQPNLYMSAGGTVHIRFMFRGRTYWISTGSPSVTAAKAGKVWRAFQSMDRAEFVAAQENEKKRGQRLLRQCINSYTAHLKRMGRRDLKKPKACLETLAAHFEGQAVDEITQKGIEGYRDTLIERLAYGGKGSRTMAPATVNRYLDYASGLFKWCLAPARALVAVNPCAGVERFPEKPTAYRALDAGEEKRLIEAALPWLKPWIVFAIDEGARKREIARLTRRHVNLKAGKRGFVTFVDTKNGENRTVPLTTRARETLIPLLRRIDHPYVFTGPDGHPLASGSSRGYDNNHLKRDFPKAWKAAGIEPLRFHDLRHTFGSNQAMKGTDTYRIQLLGGWKSEAMVKRYAHLRPEDLESAMDDAPPQADENSEEL